MNRTFRQLAPLAALLAGACLSDAPVAPRGTGLALHVNLQTTSPGQRLHVRIYYFLPQSETDSTLFTGEFPVTTGAQQVPVAFDVAPCLAARAAVDPGAPCTVFLDLQLLVNGVVADERSAGPIDVTPGQTVESPPVFLVAGNSAPRFTGTDSAVAVDIDLVRYRVNASDPDGDLLDVTARAIDSSSTLLGVTGTTFPLPRRAFDGAGYVSVPPFSRLQQVELVLDDTKGNLAGPVPVGVSTVGSTGPFAFAVVGDTTSDAITVGFDVSSEGGVPDSVEIVVRNVPDSQIPVDTTYFVCGTRFTGGSGTHSVSRARVAPFERARVTVVPFDAQGNWGSAASCALPGDCATSARRQRE